MTEKDLLIDWLKLRIDEKLEHIGDHLEMLTAHLANREVEAALAHIHALTNDVLQFKYLPDEIRDHLEYRRLKEAKK